MCNGGVVKCNESKMCFFVLPVKIYHPNRIFNDNKQDIDSVSAPRGTDIKKAFKKSMFTKRLKPNYNLRSIFLRWT